CVGRAVHAAAHRRRGTDGRPQRRRPVSGRVEEGHRVVLPRRAGGAAVPRAIGRRRTVVRGGPGPQRRRIDPLRRAAHGRAGGSTGGGRRIITTPSSATASAMKCATVSGPATRTFTRTNSRAKRNSPAIRK